MDEKIFDKVEEKTNVKREDIISLAKSIQGKDMNNERNLRKLIQDVAKLAGKKVSKEKEEKIGSRFQRIKKRCKRNYGKKEAGKEKTSGSDPQKNTNGIKRRKTSCRQIHIHL